MRFFPSLVLLVVAACSWMVLPCQDRQLRLEESSLMIGGGSSSLRGVVKSDVAKLGEGAYIIDRDFAEYPDRMSTETGVSKLYSITASISNLRDSSDARAWSPILRLGLDHIWDPDITYSFLNSTTVTVDSFYFPPQDAMLPIDSVSQRTIKASYDYRFVRLQGAWLLRSRRDRNTSFHFGPGIAVGLGFRNRTLIDYEEVYVLDDHIPSGSLGPGQGSVRPVEHQVTSSREIKENEQSMMVSAFIVMGLNYWLGKPGRATGRFALTAEGRIGAKYIKASEIGDSTSDMKEYGVGLRYIW